jgi:hypothetical protein
MTIGDRARVSGELTRDLLEQLRAVYLSPPFVAVLDELWRTQPGEARFRFVKEVLLDRAKLVERGVVLPDTVTIERTYFDDDRPTLFALVTHFPERAPFRKATITVDDSPSWQAN